MPTIRDGRGELHTYDMTPSVQPELAPIERRQVSAARMADFAAERARMSEQERRTTVRSWAAKAAAGRAAQAASRERGAQRAGFVTGASKPHQVKEEVVPPREYGDDRRARNTARREERAARILAVIRTTSSHAEAAAELGMSKHAVELFVSDLRRRRELPDDVEALLRARDPNRQGRPVRVDSREKVEGTPGSAGDRRGNDASPPEPSLRAEERATELGVRSETGVDVVLPCEGCANAIVCSIKPKIETFHEDVANLAELHPGVRITAVSIGCEYFLEAAS